MNKILFFMNVLILDKMVKTSNWESYGFSIHKKMLIYKRQFGQYTSC